MSEKGWGTAFGWLFEWIGKFTDPKHRIDRKVTALLKEREHILADKGMDSQARADRLGDITNRLDELRREREKLGS